MTQIAAPYSTGAGGPDFETHVLAYYLGCALTRSIPRGLSDAVAVSVSSQALYQGVPLDDVLVKAQRSDGHAQLALQVKRDLTFGEKNDEFQDVMRRAWETFTATDFREGVDRFGVALGLYSKTIDEHYATVLLWARHAAAADDFVTRVSTAGLSSQTQRSFLALVRTLLSRAAGQEVSDEQLWRFCRSFVLLHFDFQSEGSRDAAQLRSMLQHALSIEDALKARGLEGRLFELASEMKPAAGTQSSQTLRERLAPSFALRAAQHVEADLQRLAENAGFILQDMLTSVGGVVLPRASYVDCAVTALGTARVIALTGEPGAGKSGVLRLLVERANAQSSALILSGDRLSGTGWPAFAQGLGLTTNLRDLLRAIGTGMEPCVFVDGLDRVTTADGQRVINDLLRTVTEVSVADGRPWTVLFTTRSQNVPSILSWLAVPSADAVQAVEIGLLSDQEFEPVAARHPALALLDADERLRPMTRNLFMMARLTDARIAVELPMKKVATELDLASTWWTHVVGATGAAGVARQALLLDLAADLLQDVRTNGPFDPAALHSLESDRIVSRDNFGVVRFTHDLFEDWVFARLLGRYREQLPSFLTSLRTPFRLHRAMRLYAAMLLQDEGFAAWRELLVAIESDPSLKERWQQTIVASPLLSARATSLLDDIRPLLLEGGSERLKALLTSAVTLDVGPNAKWATMLQSLASRPELASLFMSDPTPKWAMWVPLVTWLTGHVTEVPSTLRRDAARVLELWQTHSPEGSILRGEVADAALQWLTDRAPLGDMPEDVREGYFAALRKIIFMSADVRPDAVTEIVGRVAENRQAYRARRELIDAGDALSRHIARPYADAILTMVIREREREREHRLIDDFDFDDRLFYPGSLAPSPFLPLLQNAEAEGLRLIHTLANTATDRRGDGPGPTYAPIVVQLAHGPQEFFGTIREYGWFRPDSMAPPSVISGLMALEFWMEKEVERGRDPVELFETVLTGSRCLAVPGVCLGIALAYPEKCLRAALPIVSVPHFWLLDVPRMSHDTAGSFTSMLPGNVVARTVNEERDKRPQRSQSIRDLALRYLVCGDDELTTRFTTAVSAFAENPPIFFEEERDDPALFEAARTEIQREMEFAKVENYRRTEHDGQTVIYFVKPQYLVEEDAADMQRHVTMNHRMGLLQWAERTIAAGAVDASYAAPGAVEAAVALGGAAALRHPMTDEDEAFDTRGARAVAAVAAAVAIAAPEWLQEQGRVAWCIEVLDAASRATGPAIDGHVATAIIPNDPHTYAVRGFAALVRAGVQDERIRQALLRLSIDRRLRVVAAVAGELRSLWSADRALAWEIIALGVASNLSSPYHGYAHERDPVADAALLAPHVAALGEDATPSPLARITAERDGFFADAFLYLAQGVPIDLLWADEAARPALIVLTEDLVRWTIATEREAHARDSYARGVPNEWDDVFGGWLARVAGIADEDSYDRLVRIPVEDAATEPLPLVPDFLQRYAWEHFDHALPAVPLRRSEALIRRLLETRHVAAYRDGERVSREVEEMVSIIVLMRYGGPTFKPTWTCAAGFTATIDAWVKAIAPSEEGFGTLLRLLERFAGQFAPHDVVAWLTRFASGGTTIDPATLSGDAGDRAAQVLNSIWSAHRDELLRSQELRAQYGSLVDALLAAGVALAGTLAARLRAT